MQCEKCLQQESHPAPLHAQAPLWRWLPQLPIGLGRTALLAQLAATHAITVGCAPDEGGGAEGGAASPRPPRVSEEVSSAVLELAKEWSRDKGGAVVEAEGGAGQGGQGGWEEEEGEGARREEGGHVAFRGASLTSSAAMHTHRGGALLPPLGGTWGGAGVPTASSSSVQGARMSTGAGGAYLGLRAGCGSGCGWGGFLLGG